MQISYNWLKNHLDIGLSAQETGDILTDIGLEVEKINTVECIRGGLSGLVIGEVKSVEKHPDADKLKITRVDVGESNQYQIVCGAPNVACGQKVVVALPGTVLFPVSGDSFKIKNAKIRGVESFGMICAEDEIGLGDGHDGIIVLEKNAKIGMKAADYFNVENDFIFEIGLTPNRADAMSHYGVARDLWAALQYRNTIPQNLSLKGVAAAPVQYGSENLVVEILDNEKCQRYMGVRIEGLTVTSSPDWLQQKLKAIGLTPKNNVVDITNYILHDLGQPLHAFDWEEVQGKVRVSTLPENTVFTTLDGEDRKLHSEDLMICNASEPMCIAGVFGGIKSGVKLSTTSIFLESAMFNSVAIRKTAKRFGLSTDASFRFERGIDPNITKIALEKAINLIIEICGGKVASSLFDSAPNKVEGFRFDISVNRISALCGISFTLDQVVRILSLLEISCDILSHEEIRVNVPPYRVDVKREADIAEEILRIHGFNNVAIPEKLNASIIGRPAIDNEKYVNQISDWLVGNGLTEAMSNSLTHSGYFTPSASFDPEHTVKMLNPLSSDLDVLRQSLLFGGLEAVRLNQNYGVESIKIFEFGTTYHRYSSGFSENRSLAIFLSGNKSEERWNTANSEFSFFTLKGIVEGILSQLGILKNYMIKASDNLIFDDGVSYFIAKKKIAELGWIAPELKSSFELKKEVYFAIINWDVLLELLTMNKVVFKELPKYPAVKRDLSLLLDEKVKFEDISTLAVSTEKRLLKTVSLFDVYKGKNMDGKKSYAVRFTLQDENKTLQEKEIDEVMSKIENVLAEKLNASLR